MIITISKISQEFTKNGDEYRKVTGAAGDGRETTKSIFNQLKDKWDLLVEGKTLEFKMEKRGQFWNVTDIIPVGEQLKPSTEPGELLPKHQAEIDKAVKPPPTKNQSTQTQRSITMSYAITLCASGIATPDKLLSYAEVINRWICGDIDVKDETVFTELIGKHFHLNE